MKRALALTLVGLCLFGPIASAAPTTYDEFLRFKKMVREREAAASGSRDAIGRASDAEIQDAFDQFILDEILQGIVVRLGTPTLNGESVVAHVENGVAAVLQFQLMDATSRLLTGVAGLLAAGVSRVDYTVNLDPASADATGKARYDTVIGSSTDVASFFSLRYVPSGFEDDIFAIPYDANGNAIVLNAFGENVARGSVVDIFSVPEPSSILLVAGALFVAGRRLMRRSRRVTIGDQS